MDKYSQLEKLAELKSRGVVSEVEYEIEKQKILLASVYESSATENPVSFPIQKHEAGARFNYLYGCLSVAWWSVVALCFLAFLGYCIEEYEKEQALAAEPGRRTYNHVETQLTEALGFMNIILDNANRNLSDVASEYDGGPFDSPHEANYTEDEYEKIDAGMSFYDVSVLIGNGRANHGTLEQVEDNRVLRSWLGFGSQKLFILFDKENATVVEKALVSNED